MAIDAATVRKVARLARIAEPEEKLEPLARELSGIMAWIEQLNEVDTDGVEPMTTSVAMSLPMREIAAFLGCEIAEERWAQILKHCSFEYMKANAANVAPLGGAIFDGGGATFINKGVNGRWRDVLTAQDCAEYERRAVAELGPECAHWLATGEMLVPA